jgi:hypothetical protein
MDGGKARKLEFRISSRSLILVIAVVAVLLVPVAWSIRQSQLTQNALAQALAAEKAANRDRADAEQAKGKLKILRDEAIQRAARRDPNEEAERSRQLAEEIDSLTQVHERIQEDLYRTKAKTAKSAKPAPPPTLDTLRDPRNRVRELPSAPDDGAP